MGRLEPIDQQSRLESVLESALAQTESRDVLFENTILSLSALAAKWVADEQRLSAEMSEVRAAYDSMLSHVDWALRVIAEMPDLYTTEGLHPDAAASLHSVARFAQHRSESQHMKIASKEYYQAQQRLAQELFIILKEYA